MNVVLRVLKVTGAFHFPQCHLFGYFPHFLHFLLGRFFHKVTLFLCLLQLSLKRVQLTLLPFKSALGLSLPYSVVVVVVIA